MAVGGRSKKKRKSAPPAVSAVDMAAADAPHGDAPAPATDAPDGDDSAAAHAHGGAAGSRTTDDIQVTASSGGRASLDPRDLMMRGKSFAGLTAAAREQEEGEKKKKKKKKKKDDPSPRKSARSARGSKSARRRSGEPAPMKRAQSVMVGGGGGTKKGKGGGIAPVKRTATAVREEAQQKRWQLARERAQQAKTNRKMDFFSMWINGVLSRRKKFKRSVDGGNMCQNMKDGIIYAELAHILTENRVSVTPLITKLLSNLDSRVKNLKVLLKTLNEELELGKRFKAEELAVGTAEPILELTWCFISHYEVHELPTLLNWVRICAAAVDPELQVGNFDTAWQSGHAFAVILCHYREELLSYKKVKKIKGDQSRLEFVLSAFTAVGFPEVIVAEDLEEPDPHMIILFANAAHKVFTGMTLAEEKSKIEAEEAERRRVQREKEDHEAFLAKRAHLWMMAFPEWVNTILRREEAVELRVDDLDDDFRDGKALLLVLSILTQQPVQIDDDDAGANVERAFALLAELDVSAAGVTQQHVLEGDKEHTRDLLLAIHDHLEIGDEATLLAWLLDQLHAYKDVRPKDFDKSWADGLGYVALLHHFDPELIDYEALRDASPLERQRAAFEAGADLGLPIVMIEGDTELNRNVIKLYLSMHCYACVGKTPLQLRRGRERAALCAALKEELLLKWITFLLEKLHADQVAAGRAADDDAPLTVANLTTDLCDGTIAAAMLQSGLESEEPLAGITAHPADMAEKRANVRAVCDVLHNEHGVDLRGLQVDAVTEGDHDAVLLLLELVLRTALDHPQHSLMQWCVTQVRGSKDDEEGDDDDDEEEEEDEGKPVVTDWGTCFCSGLVLGALVQSQYASLVSLDALQEMDDDAARVKHVLECVADKLDIKAYLLPEDVADGEVPGVYLWLYTMHFFLTAHNDRTPRGVVIDNAAGELLRVRKLMPTVHYISSELETYGQDRVGEGEVGDALADGTVLGHILDTLANEAPLYELNDAPEDEEDNAYNLDVVFTFLSVQLGLDIDTLHADELATGDDAAWRAAAADLFARLFYCGDDALMVWVNETIQPRGLSVSAWGAEFADGMVLAALLARYKPDVLDYASLSELDAPVRVELVLDACASVGAPTNILTADELAREDVMEPPIKYYCAQLFRALNGGKCLAEAARVEKQRADARRAAEEASKKKKKKKKGAKKDGGAAKEASAAARVLASLPPLRGDLAGWVGSAGVDPSIPPMSRSDVYHLIMDVYMARLRADAEADDEQTPLDRFSTFVAEFFTERFDEDEQRDRFHALLATLHEFAGDDANFELFLILMHDTFNPSSSTCVVRLLPLVHLLRTYADEQNEHGPPADPLEVPMSDARIVMEELFHVLVDPEELAVKVRECGHDKTRRVGDSLPLIDFIRFIAVFNEEIIFARDARAIMHRYERTDGIMKKGDFERFVEHTGSDDLLHCWTRCVATKSSVPTERIANEVSRAMKKREVMTMFVTHKDEVTGGAGKKGKKSKKKAAPPPAKPEHAAARVLLTKLGRGGSPSDAGSDNEDEDEREYEPTFRLPVVPGRPWCGADECIELMPHIVGRGTGEEKDEVEEEPKKKKRSKRKTTVRRKSRSRPSIESVTSGAGEGAGDGEDAEEF